MGDSYAGVTVPEGNPEALDGVAGDFRSLAGATADLAMRLGQAPAGLGNWQGLASMAFTGASLASSGFALAASENFAAAAAEAQRYADALREAKQDVREAIADAREAQGRIDRAESEIDEAGTKRLGAELRYAGAAAQMLTDLSGGSAASAREAMARAEQDIEEADAQERRARRALQEAREDLQRAKRRGERAERSAADAAEKASDAFAMVGAGLPGTLVPGAGASSIVANGAAPALTPFARALTGVAYGDGLGEPAGSARGPLAVLAGLSVAPSTDYRSWQDPARRQIEQEMLYGDAKPATEEFDIKDLDGLDKGKLRLGMFIAAPSAGLGVWPAPSLEGNNRGFNRQFSPNQTKGYIELDFERDKAYVQSNPTCDPGGSGCEDAKDIAQDDIANFGDFKSEVEPNDTDGNDVHLSWELSQAKGTKIPLVEGPSIDGDLHVRPGPDGRPIVELDGDDYPSREIYYDDGQGRTYPLIEPRKEDDGQYWPGDGTWKLWPGFN